MSELIASGGLIAKMGDAYALHNHGRPVRDAIDEWFRRKIERSKLPPDERIAFDIRHYGYAESGDPDVAAKVCETAEDDLDEDLYGYRYNHEWDKPITLRYTFRYLR